MASIDPVAAYAAILSTILGGWQIYRETFRERGRLRVRVTVGPKPPQVGIGAPKYLIYDISNVGKKPVAIQEIGGHKKSSGIFKLPVYEPATPVELAPQVGTRSLYTRPIKDISTTWDKNWDAKDVADLAWLGVWDTTGKVHKVPRRKWYGRTHPIWKKTTDDITEVLGRWY